MVHNRSESSTHQVGGMVRLLEYGAPLAPRDTKVAAQTWPRCHTSSSAVGLLFWTHLWKLPSNLLHLDRVPHMLLDMLVEVGTHHHPCLWDRMYNKICVCPGGMPLRSTYNCRGDESGRPISNK